MGCGVGSNWGSGWGAGLGGSDLARDGKTGIEPMVFGLAFSSAGLIGFNFSFVFASGFIFCPLNYNVLYHVNVNKTTTLGHDSGKLMRVRLISHDSLPGGLFRRAAPR